MNFNGFQSLVDRIEYELDAVLGLGSPKVAKLFSRRLWRCDFFAGVFDHGKFFQVSDVRLRA